MWRGRLCKVHRRLVVLGIKSDINVLGRAGCFPCPLQYARLSLEKDSYNHLTMHNVYKLYLTVFLADAAATIAQLPRWPITRHLSKIHFKQVKMLPSLESFYI